MYPIPDDDANLNVMKTLKETTELPVGFSDHTLGTFAIEIAVAMGAEIIEKHFTDSREEKTFRDHFVSATKEEMIAFIEKVKRIKVLKGSTEKKPVASEIKADHIKVFRRALYPARDLRAGEVICEEDLLALRPCIGIGAEKLDRIVGRRLTKDVTKYEALSEQFFEV
jgi:N-acetylneuraminate synthase/N,N'-diacetyllegionaminate synthase